MFKSKISTLAVAFIAVFAFSAVLVSSEASAEITIEDSAGHTLTLDAPAERVVAMGYAFSTTIIDLGGESKIVGCDSYSTYDYNKNEKMRVLEGVHVLGTGYTKDKDLLISGLLQLESSGKFDETKDVVILNNYSTTLEEGGLYDSLSPNYKVVCFGAKTYDESVTVVESISKIIGTDSSGSVDRMKSVKQTVIDKTEGLTDDERPSAMYISASGNTITVYDSGIAASMITICGAVNAGDKGTGLASHKADMTEILMLKPDVVFLNGNYNGTAEDFKNAYTGAEILNVVILEKDWNNYCPSIADGLEAMYASLYDSPLYDGEGGFFKDNAVYIGVAAVATVAVFAAAFVLVRRQG
jgi:ABC-type Fe3+-hydroxamate transport system substrate-binding protein